MSKRLQPKDKAEPHDQHSVLLYPVRLTGKDQNEAYGDLVTLQLYPDK